MKIVSVHCSKEELPLTIPYTIAFKTFESTTILSIVFRLENGLIGIGSGSPAPSITGEDPETSFEQLKLVAEEYLVGKSILTFHHLFHSVAKPLGKFPAALCAIDIALYDAFTKLLEIPLVDFLGRNHFKLPTSITIGIKNFEETLEEAKERVSQGFKIIKLKIGGNLEADVSNYLKLKEELGKDILIRVDANQGYQLQDLLHFAKATYHQKPEFYEQPFPPKKFEWLAELSDEIRAEIAADEDLHHFKDALELAFPQKYYGIYNIKLMKCGGIHTAQKIAMIANSYGINLMWGCMDESVISISAALHVAFASSNTKYLDLDGSFDLSKDLASGGFVLKDGYMYTNDKPGLGIELNDEYDPF